MRNDQPRRSLMKKWGDAIRRLLGRKPSPPPADPYAYSMAPLRRGPRGRSGAAVAEIERSTNEDDSYRSFAPRG
jgi:hypothetical protein